LLWYGRDYLGRRSLLLHKPVNINDNFIITSVGQLNNNYDDNNCNSNKEEDNNISNNKDNENENTKETSNESEEVVNDYWEEIKADGIYCLNLNNFSIDNVK